eukprot:3975144-Prymnesium_polylepis.1
MLAVRRPRRACSHAAVPCTKVRGSSEGYLGSRSCIVPVVVYLPLDSLMRRKLMSSFKARTSSLLYCSKSA